MEVCTSNLHAETLFQRSTGFAILNLGAACCLPTGTTTKECTRTRGRHTGYAPHTIQLRQRPADSATGGKRREEEGTARTVAPPCLVPYPTLSSFPDCSAGRYSYCLPVPAYRLPACMFVGIVTCSSELPSRRRATRPPPPTSRAWRGAPRRWCCF